MSTCILYDDNVIVFNVWQFSLYGKFVIIFTQGPDHIHFLKVLRWMFSDDANVVIGTIDGRTHQGRHTGIHADIGPINVFTVDGRGHHITGIVAGVDIIRSSHGPLLLEVNSSPGLEGVEDLPEAGALLVAHGLDPRRPVDVGDRRQQGSVRSSYPRYE